MQRILFNFYLALEGVMANQLRAILTALGIIFGVGAVIAMLAIGTGAKQSILDQMKLIGTNNIVIKGVIPSDEEEGGGGGQTQAQGKKEKKPWSPGLTIKDMAAFDKGIPTIEKISPEIVLSLPIVRDGKHQKGRCIGVTNAFFELNNLKIAKGNPFHFIHEEDGKPVCIIGKTIERRFFSDGDAIGKKIKCGNVWLTVIGILEKRVATKESMQNLGIRDYNADIYVPISTTLLRLKNRALLNKRDLKAGNWDSASEAAQNYHQLDRMVVRVSDSQKLQATADIMARMLKRKHGGAVDFEIEVPELLLQQQQQTQDTFNFVLAVIAGISLLVGGIGIMNIMLASVLERIKEIGVRRSLGANQQDIIFQFLFEAIFISLIGGILGIILGVIAAKSIASYANIPTVVSTWSILLSFGVAASVGLVFGLFPAQKAARQDPIKALRSD